RGGESERRPFVECTSSRASKMPRASCRERMAAPVSFLPATLHGSVHASRSVFRDGLENLKTWKTLENLREQIPKKMTKERTEEGRIARPMTLQRPTCDGAAVRGSHHDHDARERMMVHRARTFVISMGALAMFQLVAAGCAGWKLAQPDTASVHPFLPH